MICHIQKSTAVGTLPAPPSKSDAHRALIAAASGKGSAVCHIGDSADVTATLRSLTALGATVRKTEDGVWIGGMDPQQVGSVTLPCGESGTTMRLLLPFCLGNDHRKTLHGEGRLPSRPMEEYETLCRQNGLYFARLADGFAVGGRLSGGEYTVKADKSSQFLSGLLMYLPLCEKDSRITLDGVLQSRRYVDMTLETLSRSGITVHQTANGFFIPGGQTYRTEDYTVEGDWSSAAFLSALGLIGGNVTVTGLKEDSLQADKVFRSLALDMMNGGTVAVGDCPDLAPMLFALAAALGGGVFTGTDRLRFKESDRVAAMQQELAKCGITVVSGNDRVTVRGKLRPPNEILCGHNDHRIVMSLAVLLTLTGGSITDGEAVAKSYPSFWNDVKGLGIAFDEADER